MATGNAVVDLQTVLWGVHQIRLNVDALQGSIPDAINAAGQVTPQARTWYESAKSGIIRNSLDTSTYLDTLSRSRNDTIRENAEEAERILLAIIDEAQRMTLDTFRQQTRILDGKVADLEAKVAAIRRPMNAGKRRKTRRQTRRQTRRRKHF